jgi:hypothetical protein
MRPVLGGLDGAGEGMQVGPPVRVRAAETKMREHFMRVVGVAAMAALIGLTAMPARAQMGGGGADGPHVNLLSDTPSKTPDQIEAEQERDRKYRDSLKKIPDAKVSNDPWGSVRSDAPKTATKAPAAAKAKTKTGTAQN